jgi:hypothetical protein
MSYTVQRDTYCPYTKTKLAATLSEGQTVSDQQQLCKHGCFESSQIDASSCIPIMSETPYHN